MLLVRRSTKIGSRAATKYQQANSAAAIASGV
jgi:hypothetical protein